ncbi:MAG: FAD-binding oxidoreductase [Alphaproteobacteria bacterium]
MNKTISPIVLRRLKDAAGVGGFSENADEIAPHLSEWRGRWHGKTPLLLKPNTTGAVSRILAICNEMHTPLVPQGGNTGLVGGQIPTQGEVLLSLERMNRVRGVNAVENSLIAEAGVVLANIQKAATDVDRLFPLSLAAEGSCTIGGNLSTNAGGVGVLHYGVARDLVLGIEVVLADGRVLDMLRTLRKDNTGYDLKHLFIGAEGTLGIITAAALKLFPRPRSYSTVFAAIASAAAALPLLNRLQEATGGLVTAFEIISRAGLDLVLKHIPGTSDPLQPHKGWFMLAEVSNPPAFDALPALESAFEQAVDAGLLTDAVFAKNERDRAALWRLRETLSEAQKLEGASVKHDVSLPLSRIAEFLERANTAVIAVLPGARPVAFGHIGDGNIHFNIAAPPGDDAALLTAREKLERVVHDEARRAGGSISAEHGIGLAKRDELSRYKNATELEVMRALKCMLDPNNILNPGKLLA